MKDRMTPMTARAAARRGAMVAAMGLAAGLLALPAGAAEPQSQVTASTAAGTTASLKDAAIDVKDETFICKYVSRLPYLCPRDED